MIGESGARRAAGFPSGGIWPCDREQTDGRAPPSRRDFRANCVSRRRENDADWAARHVRPDGKPAQPSSSRCDCRIMVRMKEEKYYLHVRDNVAPEREERGPCFRYMYADSTRSRFQSAPPVRTSFMAVFFKTCSARRMNCFRIQVLSLDLKEIYNWLATLLIQNIGSYIIADCNTCSNNNVRNNFNDVTNSEKDALCKSCNIYR